ncbi:RNase HII [Salegentibacter echinorum]|uniref:Ribonuclease HII n=1 Tax=Salegentibacter echinorum TaxID=1073325 RepID=A0A1M5MD92_SALEC|nr:ribonuclease HII [Salegentibacter echinorum]SHG75288.1 RNase HII [Salegentibacter echinorum]
MLKRFNLSCQVAGTDEAGRGCLAGPVTAAAVILPKNFKNSILNDSKQIKLKDRLSLKEIIQQEAITYGVAHVFMEEIDKVNILNASILAMHRAIAFLSCDPEYIIVDGNKFKPYLKVPHECVIKGDGKYLSIAAASILAKTCRDAYMEEIHEEFPMYNWKQNKGYPTREHRAGIQKFGSTPYHRKSFRLLPEQVKLDF